MCFKCVSPFEILTISCINHSKKKKEKKKNSSSSTFDYYEVKNEVHRKGTQDTRMQPYVYLACLTSLVWRCQLQFQNETTITYFGFDSHT